MPAPATTSVDELFERYAGFLIDAYGVLVHASGSFPGASRFIERLKSAGKPFCIITNDASRPAESCAQKYRRDGIDISADRVITSASLLIPYFEEHALQGSRVALLGLDSAETYVIEAGATLVDPVREDFDVLVICDESGYPFIPTIDAVVTRLIDRIDRERPPVLLLPNPDLIYQRNESEYGITSGSVAAMIEAILASRYPERDLRFNRLGKPHRRIFDHGVDRCGTDDVVVLGDQLETDIRGARAAGLDSVLVATGLDHGALDWESHEIQPTYVLESLI